MATYPAYSTRFFLSYNQVGWWNWTVPVQKRAVIRSVAMWNGSGGNAEFTVAIGSTPVAHALLPGATLALTQDIRQVAYHGEQLWFQEGAANCGLAVSGYLFQDLGTTAADIPAPEQVAPPDWYLELADE